MAKKELESFVSPFGTARYPHLETPDDRFTGEGAKPQFKVGVVLTDAEAEAIEAKCVALFKKTFPDKPAKNLKLPIKEDEKAGTKYLEAKSAYKPKVYDAKKKPLPEGVELGGGSRLRIAGALNPYATGAVKGVSMYLYDVQFTKLVARGAGGMMDEVEMDDAADADVDVSGADIDI